jgi:N-terminal domain of galactosyltransferase
VTPVLVPRRGDGAWRDRCWGYVERWWRKLELGPVITGDAPGAFNRAAARNDAARRAGDWDVAVFVDADTIMVDATPVIDAIEVAREQGIVVLPHDHYIGLTARGTRQIIRGQRWDRQVKVRKEAAPLGVVVVPRTAWDTVGGFDARFRGWGGEDTAFKYAASTLVGLERSEGTLLHLWHPVDPTKRAYIIGRGGPLRAAYTAALNDVEAMRELVAVAPSGTGDDGAQGPESSIDPSRA